jgi:quinone-modifying oxidoreductase, subunit QmoC
MKFKREIKFEADLDPAFAKWITSVPGCEKLRHCIQCGTCSATCPLSIYMDLTPRKLINMARAGFKKEVLGSFTPWLCASCYSCTVECPKQIKVTDVMYALKRRALEEGVYPKGQPVSVLAKQFFWMVRNFGRVTENYLVVMLFLQTNWFKFLGFAKLGLKLFLTGRMEYTPSSIKKTADVKKMLDYLEAHPASVKEVEA